MVAASRITCHLLRLTPLLATTAAQLTGTFDFLTYNVAGLPSLLSGNGVPGDKGTNAGIIGSKLAERAYDVVHMQEVC